MYKSDGSVKGLASTREGSEPEKDGSELDHETPGSLDGLEGLERGKGGQEDNGRDENGEKRDEGNLRKKKIHLGRSKENYSALFNF